MLWINVTWRGINQSGMTKLMQYSNNPKDVATLLKKNFGFSLTSISLHLLLY